MTPNAYALLWHLAERVTNDTPQIRRTAFIGTSARLKKRWPRVDYGMISKKYAAEAASRYSPAKFVAAIKEVIKATRIRATSPRHTWSARI